MELTILPLGENCSNGVVRSIRLDNELSIGSVMSEDRRCRERGLECVECIVALSVEVPRCVFASEAHKRYCDLGVLGDETTIEVCEPEERLNVFDLSRFRLILNRLNLFGCHGETRGRKNVS